MSKYVELTVTTTHEASEIVSDILWEYSEGGVAINDFYDVIALSKAGKTWDYIDDAVLNNDGKVLVKGYIEKSVSDEKIAEIEKRLIRLKENCPFNVGTLETSKREVDGDEWKDTWKKHFKPIRIGKIVVVPEWIKYKCRTGEIPVPTVQSG